VVRRSFCQTRVLRGPALLVICVFALPCSCIGQETRIPRQQPRNAALLGTVHDQDGRPVPGVTVRAINRTTGKPYTAKSDAEGIFRLVDLPAGEYDISAAVGGVESTPAKMALAAGQLRSTDIRVKTSISSTPLNSPSGLPGAARAAPVPDVSSGSVYPGMRSPQSVALMALPEFVPTPAENFSLEPYRWTVAMPAWQRYNTPGDYPYVRSHWYDPFNRNRWKGDYPIFGQQWFLRFTGTSFTDFDLRRLPTPSGLGSENPNSELFFGGDQQTAVGQTFLFSFDLFHGDTSFRPIDFQLRFTPAVNLNFLQAQERGIVNVNVEAGTTRFDAHAGLQEGFFELKLHDLGPNFDFVSVRAGIQQFNSDFRGFIFSDEEPGVRIFGNLRSNRINYNLAYFFMLEKDTNSHLNTFAARDQQVEVANVYIQDFLTKGYTTEFSFLANQDNASIKFDTNGFLVRPAPIGSVVIANGIPQPHSIRSYYLGWTGNGHIKRLNVSNAFYQALGYDTFNTIAGRRVNINGQLAALELSIDKNWLRFRGSVFYTSGDGSTQIGASRSDAARGFDSIFDDQHFAGTNFSFWDRESIPLSSTGVALVTPASLIPDLRSSKIQGQSNFVNPGVRLYNVGVDADLTPKLRGFVNASYLQFDHTQPLQLVLFQPSIGRSVGMDFGAGVNYRPPLSENIVLTTGIDALVPGTGYKEIYNSKTLLSGFAGLRFQF
jgi:Carboxypeptidase regulatory-like domain